MHASILYQDGKEVLDQINELVQKESDRIGKLIGCILLKKYPGAASSAFKVTFNDLMEWDVWPCFIKISGKERNGILLEFNVATCRYLTSPQQNKV